MRFEGPQTGFQEALQREKVSTLNRFFARRTFQQDLNVETVHTFLNSCAMAAAASAGGGPPDEPPHGLPADDVGDDEQPENEDVDDAMGEDGDAQAEDANLPGVFQRLPNMGRSRIETRLEALREERIQKRKAAASASKDLRNEKRKQSRLKNKALRLNNNDLIEVFRMRAEAQAKAAAKAVPKAKAAAKGKAHAKEAA